jgi:hypothetical protein
MQELPISQAFMLREPGPVILVSTNTGRKNNIMTISWHMAPDFIVDGLVLNSRELMLSKIPEGV